MAPTTFAVDGNLAAGIVARDVLIAALPASSLYATQLNEVKSLGRFDYT